MNVLAVVENEAAQLPMTEMLSAMEPEANLMCFGSSLPALAAARKQEIDIAVIDAVLPELSGLDFGRYLQELYPDVNLIYLAADKESGYEALRQHASGILPKPIVETELRRELPDCRVVLIVDDSVSEDVNEDVKTLKQTGVIDAFLFTSAANFSYLSAILQSI